MYKVIRHPRKCLPLAVLQHRPEPQYLPAGPKGLCLGEKVDPAGSCNPDLHFNRATLHKYEENYTEALEGFFHAASFESAWPKTWQPQQQLLDFLECLTSLLENKGKVKGNKLQSTLGSLHPSQMGPCGDGQYQGSLGQEVALERRLLSALQLCVNIGAIVLGRVSSALPQKRKCPCEY
nr:tetratricopeptide repeat protein 5 [Chelonoidis abingdonii]